MSMLLDLLDEQIAQFRAGHTPDFDAMQSIMEYTLNYPDLCHHPLEDVVYRRLLERRPEAAASLINLPTEHRQIAERNRRLAASIRNLLHDEPMSRDEFEAIATGYVETVRQHMREEEQRFFPLAITSLDDRDWQAIEQAVTTPRDPLFGGPVAERYRRLHERILRLGA
jgi:hemerythrin-like domain-containing protein